MKMTRVFELAGTTLIMNLEDSLRAIEKDPKNLRAQERYGARRKELIEFHRLQAELFDGSLPGSPEKKAKDICCPITIIVEASMAAKKEAFDWWKKMERSGMLTYEQVREREQGAIWSLSFMKTYLARLTGSYLPGEK